MIQGGEYALKAQGLFLGWIRAGDINTIRNLDGEETGENRCGKALPLFQECSSGNREVVLVWRALWTSFRPKFSPENRYVPHDQIPFKGSLA